MSSKKFMFLILAAFTVVMMTVFFAVPSAIGVVGEEVGAALQSAAEFTGTEDDVQEILDRITHETTQDPNAS
jgi:biopolymer transport protein ExbB/TolQ